MADVTKSTLPVLSTGVTMHECPDYRDRPWSPTRFSNNPIWIGEANAEWHYWVGRWRDAEFFNYGSVAACGYQYPGNRSEYHARRTPRPVGEETVCETCLRYALLHDIDRARARVAEAERKKERQIKAADRLIERRRRELQRLIDRMQNEVDTAEVVDAVIG